MASLMASRTPLTMTSLATSSTLVAYSLSKSYLPSDSYCSLSISHLSYPSFHTSKRKFNPLQPITKLRVSATSINQTPTPNQSNPNNSFSSALISDSTRSIATIFAIGLSISKLFSEAIRGVSSKVKGICTSPSPEELGAIKKLQGDLVCTVGPLFFAAVRNSRPEGQLNTPFTVVASGMSKWLDIYSGVLMVRVLLSWFPNIPWDRQPLSAIRDLCDPYLNLFRNIIPPVFNTLDVSPLLAFAVLGVFGSILNSTAAV